MKDKKGVTITNAFQKILKKFDRKPNKIVIFTIHNIKICNSIKKWLKDNDIEMYLIHNKGKSVVAERCIRTLKTKIYKYMTLISKYLYIKKLDDIVSEYNNTCHRTNKMKLADAKNETYIDFF